MATTQKLLNVNTTPPQPTKGAGGISINVEGFETFSIYVEQADLNVTGSTIRPGIIMGGNADLSGRALYSLADQQVVTGITALGTIQATQESEGRWFSFDLPHGAKKATAWLEAATAGNVNIVMAAGR
jgi:hypothetical protein